MTSITGIALLHNEDVHVDRSLRNVAGFCDRIIVADNKSNDGTWDILCSLASEYPHIELHRIDDTGESHDLIAPLAGSDAWVFGIDGDEIYDPEGLLRFRKRLLSGQYDDWWAIFGNVLNVVDIDRRHGHASGYLAPPCRSITKLYNFKAIERWEGPSPERLHGGHRVFRPGHDESRRLDLHLRTSWDEAELRCLHMCFMHRSSKDKQKGGRVNPAELHARGRLGRWLDRLPGRSGTARHSQWKLEKYQRGDRVTVDIDAFFPEYERGRL